MACEFSGIMEILEVLVISANTNRMCGTEEQRVTTLEAKDHGSKFLIMSIVILLCQKEAPGMKGDRMDAVFKLLCNDHSEGVARCVSLHDKLFGPIRSVKNWVVAADFFEAKKGGIVLRGPNELFILASEVIKGVRDVREILDKHSIEVTET